MLSEDAQAELKTIMDMINQLFAYSVEAFDKRDFAILDKVDEFEEKIDNYSAELELRHVERLKQGKCSAQTGSIYLQTVSHIERVGDHITNMAFSIKQYRHK